MTEAKVFSICSPLAAEGIVYLVDGEYNFFQSPIQPFKLEMMRSFIENSGVDGCTAAAINDKFKSMANFIIYDLLIFV